MNEKEFEEFLHEQIPMTKAMDISVNEFTPARVVIGARLEPNINHKSTAFGGSINSLMTVCGWAMAYINIKPIDEDAHIVIQKSSINYLAPVNGDFTAECILTNEERKNEFFDMYEKFGKARIKLNVCCYCEGRLTAKYEGQYVAFK